MFKAIKRIFVNPTAIEMAIEEHKQAQISMLVHQTAEEYNRAMVQFDMERIARLENYINFGQKRFMEVELG